MKIGIDARLYGLKHRGIGRYVKNLCDLLAEEYGELEIVFFLTPDNFKNFKISSVKHGKALLNARWYGFKEQWLVPLVAKKHNIDIMHFTHFNTPLFYRRKFILTMHDLTINRFPDSRATTLPLWLYRLKLIFYEKILKHAINKAEKIICPSNHVKKDVQEIYGIAGGKITVIHEGADMAKQQTNGLNISIPKPYFLYVGAAYPHKNLEMLIKAFKNFNTQNQYNLILVGRHDYFYQKLISQTKDESIIFSGEASENELSQLYQNALAFAFPSLSEGFGLPVLEAQALGCPVISSNATCLPEILGSSALYFNPLNIKDIEQSFKTISQNEKLRKQLAGLGQTNCLRFNWQKMVKQTVEIYQSINS